MSDKNNRLNIFLIKEDYDTFEKIVADGAVSTDIDDIGTFYCEDSHPRTPDWVRNFFGTTLDDKFNLITSSAKGLLLLKNEHEGKTYIFAVAFGTGRHLLNDDVIEERFGLKVVLNSVTRDSLRSIDKTTLGSNPKQSREQISRASPASSFGIDIEQDLLNSVTGRSNYAALGKTITGRDSLAVSVKINMNTIKDYSLTCLERYLADDYKDDYEWIDQIKDVRSQKTITTLNELVVAQLAAKNYEKIWMAPPDILDWVNVKGFKYSKRKSADLNDDLDIIEFVASLGDKEIDLDLLKGTQVAAISSKNDEEIAHWTAYKCLYAEVAYDNKMHILHSGKWYEIAKSFSDEILTSFANTPECDIVLPEYSHDNEGAYNKELPTSLVGSHCMDADMIMHGGGHSSIEFCDLMTADKRLIHVKHYSGSAQLSHLFSQGVVSGELFVQDEEFRKKLNDKLPAAHKLADVSVRPKPEDYEVVFAVISKSVNPLEIPFFSKVSLRSAKKRLEGYGYKVTKKKILRQVAA